MIAHQIQIIQPQQYDDNNNARASCRPPIPPLPTESHQLSKHMKQQLQSRSRRQRSGVQHSVTVRVPGGATPVPGPTETLEPATVQPPHKCPTPGQLANGMQQAKRQSARITRATTRRAPLRC